LFFKGVKYAAIHFLLLLATFLSRKSNCAKYYCLAAQICHRWRKR